MCHQSTVAIVCDLGFDEKNKREREASGSGSSTVCGGGQNLIHFLLQSPKGNLPTVYHLYGLKGRGKRHTEGKILFDLTLQKILTFPKY